MLPGTVVSSAKVYLLILSLGLRSNVARLISGNHLTRFKVEVSNGVVVIQEAVYQNVPGSWDPSHYYDTSQGRIKRSDANQNPLPDIDPTSVDDDGWQVAGPRRRR